MLFRNIRSCLLLVILFTAGATAYSQQPQKQKQKQQKEVKQSKGLTSLRLARLKSVDNVIISPDGNKVAYTLKVKADPRLKNEKPSYHLYILDLLSGDPAPYVTAMNLYAVNFRPAHNTLTFLGRRKGDKVTALYEISLEGGEAQKLFSFKSSIVGYTWSPDGNHLAFMASDPSRPSQSPLPYQPEIFEENLIQRRGYIKNITKPQLQPQRLQVKGSVYQMHWSPDGERLAATVAPTPLIDDYYMKQQVIIMDRAGKKVINRIDHNGKLGQIGWSPDGNYLAMIAGADIRDPIDGRLFVVSADGDKPNNLKPDYEGKFEQFQWVDENTLHFITSRSAWSTYGRINKDGTGMQFIVNTGGPILHSFSRARTGTVAFTIDSPEHPDEVYVLKEGDRQPKRMTNSNPWLKNVALGKQEVVTWQAADSVKLAGILMYPVNYNKENKYPLITVVHGGPEDHFSNGWLTSYTQPGQVAAAKNYFVFYPNYRGSTGRGEAFSKSNQADMAGAEFDDIIAGIDELIAVGAVDSAKVGVTGASYGGYATGWLSTKYTDRFAAGVMYVGISDAISRWGTSDIPNELYQGHGYKHVWEDYEYYLKRSPIYHAGKTKTPLLILAGKEDTRVDPGQSYELYRHIKTRTNTPVRLVLYPGEGHGNARSTAQFDYNIRMMRWLGQYLKGEEKQPDAEIKSRKVRISN